MCEKCADLAENSVCQTPPDYLEAAYRICLIATPLLNRAPGNVKSSVFRDYLK